MKKLCLLLSVLAMLLCSTVALAAPADAIEAAKAEVPAGAVMYGIEEDDGKYEISFRDNETFRVYEVEVIAATNKVKEVEIKGSNIVGSTTIAKTPEDIKAIVLEAYPDAQNLVIKTEKEGNNTKYEAKFSTPKYKEVEIELNPVTGAFGKVELKYF